MRQHFAVLMPHGVQRFLRFASVSSTASSRDVGLSLFSLCFDGLTPASVAALHNRAALHDHLEQQTVSRPSLMLHDGP